MEKFPCQRTGMTFAATGWRVGCDTGMSMSEGNSVDDTVHDRTVPYAPRPMCRTFPRTCANREHKTHTPCGLHSERSMELMVSGPPNSTHPSVWQVGAQ
jgi:hypothetical protein